MRRSARQLKLNQGANTEYSEAQEPGSKRQKLVPVSHKNVGPKPNSREATPAEALTPNQRRVATTPVKKEARFNRSIKSPDKEELTSSPRKSNFTMAIVSSGPKPKMKMESLKVKAEKSDAVSASDSSFEKSPKVDENKDPAQLFIKTESQNKDPSDDVKMEATRPNEPGSDASEDEDDSFNYAKMREKNLKENELFFASLGLDQAKEQLQRSVAKPKKLPTQKGLKLNKEPKEILPRRHSLRIKRIDPTGNPLPEPEPEPQTFEPTRLPPGPLGFKACFYSKSKPDIDEHLKAFSTQMRMSKANADGGKPNVRKATDFLPSLDSMSITEDDVAKVVPGRVFSLTWHPVASPLIAVAGDKYGHVGIWNVDSRDEDQMVTAFRPHLKPVSCLLVPPKAHHKLYSCSYDATLRCGDFERGIFDEVFSVPEQDDDLLRNFGFLDKGSHSMLVSQYSGNVSLVDTRTSKNSAEQVFRVSQKSLRTVSIHPLQPDYFITAGVDANIRLWDIRNLPQKSPKPVQVLPEHSKAIASAYFSPEGHKIVSSSADDTINVYSVSSSMTGEGIKLFHGIRHNNCTGRWLTNFQPTWHPIVPDVFVVGSMARPREIQVFDAFKGRLLRSLTSEEHLGSVCSLNVFHPGHPATLVGANSSGRLHVFK